MRDLPLVIALEQRKHVGSTRMRSGQLARPMFHFQMNDGDRLDDLDARKARSDIRRGAVLVDPREYMLYGTRVLHALAVTGNGCGGMERRPHEIAVTGTSACNIAMHGASDCVMLKEIRVRRWF